MTGQFLYMFVYIFEYMHVYMHVETLWSGSNTFVVPSLEYEIETHTLVQCALSTVTLHTCINAVVNDIFELLHCLVSYCYLSMY